ncbi:hypothetical protein KDW99_18300 [Marinomonas rhizomae]|uniref:hypothetical protein n=1 Tax=Marinomonas rhizomae TaxID=491948 RepID=UPI002103EC12|nr:hypothetical protein [Marinomonas rhizomae]UTV99171.1 hypothetical protein KDW99_18300 [Marinomonas rhizomae]
MGWKGTVRSIGAAVRAAERDAKKRQRELERQHKQYDKMQALEQAAYEVELYENQIDIIQSVHKECSTSIDWHEIALSKQPHKPQIDNEKELEALKVLEDYKPSFVDRLFKREVRKKELFQQKVTEAIEIDKDQYEHEYAKWQELFEEWKERVEIAKDLLLGKVETKKDVIKSLDPFSEISNLGSSLEISFYGNGVLEATINVHGTEIVPSKSKSLLASGKLSIKSMPKGRFNEIYQDYVCSCVLRVANELFATLPDDLVVVTAVDELLNTQTGHLEEAPILSVLVSRNTIKRLNLESIDPSDSMSNFKHNMEFKKTKGFSRVERINVEELALV